MVSGGVGIAGNCFIGGNLTTNSTITSGGNVSILNTNSSSSSTTGAFVVNGGVGIAGNCFVGGNINNVKITQPANSATLTLANNSQLITSGAFNTTFISVTSSNLTLPNIASDTLVGRTTTDTLTNKTLTNPIISAIVNTGTLNLPTITDTLVGRTTTDTLTNKTLTNPTINGGSLSGTFTGASSISSTIFIGDLSGTSLRATNIAGGSAGQIHYQSATGITLFTASGQVGQVLVSNGSAAPFWITTVNSAGNIAGGSAGQIPYQSATGTTLFTASGQVGQVLVSNGTGAPIWGSTVANATNATNATNVSTTTTTNATTYYLTFAGSNSSTTQSLNVTGSITVNPNTNTISATAFSGSTVTTSSDITINNKGSLIVKDTSATISQSNINQDTGVLQIINNAPTTLNGNTIFQNKNPSGINIEVLRLNYNNVISQKDLQVNGNINLSGNIFVNNNLLSLTTIFTNNSTNWNSDLLGVSIPSTANYYLIATLGDFNNNANFGSLTIKGSIGGGSGSNTTVIDATIMTRGNNPTPTINGLIQNYSSSNSTLCDIIIYYTGTIPNTNSYGSNGSNNGAQYYVYIVTNKLGGSRNIYFDLSIKGNGSSANTIYLYNPSSLTTSPTGFSVVPSLLDQLNTLDNNTNTIYSNMGLTVASINRGTNAGIPSIVSGVYTFPITDGTNNCYLNVTNPGFIPGASYQVSMTCYTVPTSFTNGMYFTLEASGNTTPLYTSPNLSIVSTTYLANIVITTANFLNIHVFVPGGGTTSNSISISNFIVKRIDYYHTGFLGIGTTTPIYNLDVNGNMASSSLNVKDQLVPSSTPLLIYQYNNVANFDNYNTSNQYIQFRNKDAGGIFNVRLSVFYDAVSVMNGTVFRVFNPANTTYFELVNDSNSNVYLSNNSAGKGLTLRTVATGGGYIENIAMTPTLTTINGSTDVISSRTRFVGYNSSSSLDSNVFNPIVEIINNYPTSSTNLNDPTSMLSMRRVGTGSQSYDAVASFTLSRYAAVGNYPNTRLDINLNGSDQSTTLAPVMTFFAPSTVGGLGRVGINTTNPQYNLDVVGVMKVGNTGTGFITINSGDTNSGYIEFRTSDNTRRGFIGYKGTTSLYIALQVENTYVGYECNGIIRAASFNATSDYRMKDNVHPLSVNKTIDNLKPVEYDLSGGTHDMGFLAHEVQEEYPFLVQGEKDGTSMQSLNYNGFIALLVKEVQELKTNFKTLSLENEMLREKVKSLENKVEILGEK